MSTKYVISGCKIMDPEQTEEPHQGGEAVILGDLTAGAGESTFRSIDNRQPQNKGEMGRAARF